MFIPYLDDIHTWWKHPRIYLFYGKSGSGKSTYAWYLAKSIPSIYILHHYDEKIEFKKLKESWIYIDELVTIWHFFIAIRYLIDGKSLILASHIHPYYFSILQIFYEIRSFYLDKIPSKIEKYLQEKKYTFSKKAINRFVDIFGSNFTDLDIVLQSRKHWEDDFDTMLTNFLETHSISYIPNNK